MMENKVNQMDRQYIVLEVFRSRPDYTAGMATAAALTLINFIENVPTSRGRGPSLPTEFEVFLPKAVKKRGRKGKAVTVKRKYTKKSKFWAKKK